MPVLFKKGNIYIMANIEDYLDNAMTLNAMYDEIIKQQSQRKRNYLGMSEIGEDCWRMLWYRFRNVLEEHLTINSILAIEDGYNQEEITAKRLRLVKGIELDTVDPNTGEQFEYKFFGGHFCGHSDGIIKGILEAPRTTHIWENKAVNDKKFKTLLALILDVGEKQALEKWDETYYAQAQIYMESSKLTRHYLTVSNSGGRKYTSVRTELKPKVAISLKAKAENIITADRPPNRLSENRSFYKCGWCAMKEICFDSKVPAVNCRTCAFSEPDITDKNMSGAWTCLRKDKKFIGQGQVCGEHLFLNTLVPYKTVDADKSGGAPDWIKYMFETGETFYNINCKSKKIPSATCLTSEEIYNKDFFELCFNSKNDKLKEIQEEKTTTKKLKGVI
jgi:hypothetical protein